jgi:hypothetical protein
MITPAEVPVDMRRLRTNQLGHTDDSNSDEDVPEDALEVRGAGFAIMRVDQLQVLTEWGQLVQVLHFEVQIT